MKKILLSVVLFAAATSIAFGWGRTGHRLVGLIAQEHLTPVALANVQYLLGKETLADVSPWADEYRQDHPETAGWHFVDIPGAQNSYDRLRDCPAPRDQPNAEWRDCAVDRILYFEARLKDPSLDNKEKAVALKFLVHLVGDVHQPLHAIGEARGGNQIRVSQFGTQQCGERQLCNLHSTWDEGLMEHRNLNEKKYDAALESEIREGGWEKENAGTPVDWVNASHHYAQDAFVPNGTLITQQYYKTEIPIVDRQLALAGLRLANILNGIFTEAPPAK
jgi:S1/P1 Nuclease